MDLPLGFYPSHDLYPGSFLRLGWAPQAMARASPIFQDPFLVP